MNQIKEARSGINPLNLQEVIEASTSAQHATLGGQQQYELDPKLAAFCAALLPTIPDTIMDPQVASGRLVREGVPHWVHKFGWEIDRRYQDVDDGVQRIIGNCVEVWDAIADLFPDLRFQCQVANPPFAVRWRTPAGTCDSSQYTWEMMLKFASPKGFGYFVSNWRTIERLGIHEHPSVYFFQKWPAGWWKNCNVEIGIVHFDHSPSRPERAEVQYHTLDLAEHVEVAAKIKEHYLNQPANDRAEGASDWLDIYAAIIKVREVLTEEKTKRSEWNVWIDHHGLLRVYLSSRFVCKRKLTREEVLRVHKVDGAHPLSLTPEKETRQLMAELVNCGLYTIQPEARNAIEDALADVNRLSCPIMPVGRFASVAYSDEEEMLLCRADLCNQAGERIFTCGHKYPINTASYEFTEHFVRNKPHFDEKTGMMTTTKHDCCLNGVDRYISIRDDQGYTHRFMDRPQRQDGYDHDEELLMSTFQLPVVNTVAEVYREDYERNKRCLSSCELLADFVYYPGQLEFLARVAVRDNAVIAAATGAGKTLMAISLIQMKGPKRALIVAPQGTMRGSDDPEHEDDDDLPKDYFASQWLAELRRFAAGLPVFQLFSREDYDRIVALNGELPEGAVYVTYYEAFTNNGARETAPSSWDDERLELECQRILGTKQTLPPRPENNLSHRYWCENLGHEKNGIRCILEPSLATQIGHLFDLVALDEGHKIKSLNAVITQTLIRLQPKYRYVFTASPVPNTVVDLFPLMGWTAVPDWYKGGRRNAAWPYAREDFGRFSDAFLVLERDLTEEHIRECAARQRGDYRYKAKCEKKSPIISAPARLLKIVSPNLAYIGKQMCNPLYKEPTLVDVRVPMGSQQTALYVWFMNRNNVPGKNPLVRAMNQVTILRAVCAAPARFKWGGPPVTSNFNPKQVAILELVRDIVNRGEQVVVVCASVYQNNCLQLALHEAGVLVSRIDSTVPAHHHSRQSNLFKAHKTQVMLMGIKCAVAHSFSECPNMIIGSLEYSWGSLDQARGRVDRVNSKFDRTIYCVLHQHSIEEIQFETVSAKADSSTIVLQGRRVPRDFKPVDMSEVLAQAITDFKDTGMDERQCEAQWPRLRSSFHAEAFNKTVQQQPAPRNNHTAK